MDYSTLLNSALQSEMKVREASIKIAEYHKSVPGIYYGSQFMSSLSDDNIEIIKSLLRHHSVKMNNDADSSLNSDELFAGSMLIDDLNFMLKLKNDTADIYNRLLNSEKTVDRINARNLVDKSGKQTAWLYCRIEEAKQKAFSG